jgi:hypothetical protein
MHKIARALLPILLVFTALFVGCTTKSRAREDALRAYIRGQHEAGTRPASPTGQPHVRVLGEVARRDVPWEDGLTVARALLAAEYRGARDPAAILIVRGGQRHAVNVRRLLSGTEDPELQPGDVLEIIR